MEIESKIEEFILKNLSIVKDTTLNDNASFLETGVVDSTGVMELVTFVQSEFGVTVEPWEIVVENFDSINKVARFARRKLDLLKPNGSPVVPPLSAQPLHQPFPKSLGTWFRRSSGSIRERFRRAIPLA